MFGPGQPPPHTWTTPVRAATPDNAGAQTNAQAAGTAGAQAQAGQQGGAPPPANTQAAQEQANAQAAAQEFGTAMLRALGLAPPAPAAGDANPQAGAAGAPVPGMQEAAQTLLGGLFGAMGAGAPGALAPGAPGAPGAGVAAGGGAGGTGNGVHVVHGPVMFEFVTGMPMPPANANNDAANAPSNNTADGGQGAGNGAHVHVHQHVHVHGGHDGGHGPHIHFWEPPVAGAGAPPVAGVPGNAQPNANAAGTPNGPGIAQAAARAAARNAQANAPPPPPLEWSPPPAPGPTLRDRVERREREAGLRCCDASCGVGPSDEEPWAETSELGVVPVLRPLSSSASTSTVNANPSSKDGVKEGAERATACAHTFHASCLVSAQRARGGWREPTAAEEEVPVVCSVCRAEGVVPREAWEAGCVPPLD
ncbi:hypothetical protein DFH07DRAFT_827965 [Mycena maculata]|uniref:Uncharacterized protein n=1 Tax=Mycena maculata TaxID=230809 RepID=A0AAD7N933_9AGAR|nr:hypothetical protein DFH07DRAFT_827965 [Mycena maculata]